MVETCELKISSSGFFNLNSNDFADGIPSQAKTCIIWNAFAINNNKIDSLLFEKKDMAFLNRASPRKN